MSNDPTLTSLILERDTLKAELADMWEALDTLIDKYEAWAEAVEKIRVREILSGRLEQEAELKAEVERLRNKLREFNWYQYTGKPPARYS